MAVIQRRLISATVSGSIMSVARHSVCQSRGLRLPKRLSIMRDPLALAQQLTVASQRKTPANAAGVLLS